MYVHVASDRSWSTWAPTRPCPKSGWKGGRTLAPMAFQWQQSRDLNGHFLPRGHFLTTTDGEIRSTNADPRPNIASAWHEAKKCIFFPRTHNLPVSRETTQTLFPFILHHLSPVILAKSDSSGICTVSFVVLGSNPMVIHSVIQRLLRNRPGSGRCHRSWFFARKITKCTDSCKPASLNCPM